MNFQYTSTAGFEANVPANIHKMIQRGAEFPHVNGGKLNKRCVFIATDSSEKFARKVDATIQSAKANSVTKPAKVEKPKAAKAVRVSKVAGKKSNADLMREYVAQAKKEGKTLEDAIAYGINTIGQNKSAAKKYATDIWNGK